MTEMATEAPVVRTGGPPWLAIGVLGTVLVFALLGPFIAPHEADAISLRDAMTPPVWDAEGDSRFLLGTDNLGRDILSRIIAGARISVTIAAYAIVLSGGIGAALGMIAGYFGGWVDLVFQRLIEIWSGMPTLYLLIILASVVTPTFGWLLGLMLLFSWMTLVGVVRAEVLRVWPQPVIRVDDLEEGTRSKTTSWDRLMPILDQPEAGPPTPWRFCNRPRRRAGLMLNTSWA